MAETVLGARIRDRRRDLGLTQAELARRVGISASYLNLIERNKRRIGGALLQRTASELGVHQEALDGEEERRLVRALQQLGDGARLTRHGPEAERAAELVGSFPGWARAIADLAESERTAHERASALSERLSNDPFLADSVHRMLGGIAAIRSTAEILEDYADISPEDRRRFDRILVAEAQALSEIGENLVRHFDAPEVAVQLRTPQDELDALLAENRNRFPVLESLADAAARTLQAATRGQRQQTAQNLAEDRCTAEVDTIIAASGAITTEEGRVRAQKALLDHAAQAILLPMVPISTAAQACAYDAEILAHHFDVPLGDIFRRFATLSPVADHPRMGYLRANASGTMIELLPYDWLLAPRRNPPCPHWILLDAQRRPGEIRRHRVPSPSGDDMTVIAVAANIGQPGFGAPRSYVTDVLWMPVTDAERTVYGAESTAQMPSNP
ncbi:MAG: helix-turn-helix domain-containing protein [Pseudomonadota bacterium]